MSPADSNFLPHKPTIAAREHFFELTSGPYRLCAPSGVLWGADWNRADEVSLCPSRSQGVYSEYVAEIEDYGMATKLEIYEAAQEISRVNAVLYDELKEDSEFKRRGGKIYPYDTIGANLDPIFGLLNQSGREVVLTDNDVSRVADIGCANGELSLVLSKVGYQVLAVDYSFRHDQAPYVVSWIAKKLGLPLTVVDASIDRQFDLVSLRDHIVSDTNKMLTSPLEPFSLTICVGLLYHLKSPFAFLQSLSEVTSYCVLGTHLFTHLPEDERSGTVKWPLAYLLGERELNYDPTNYWIFNDAAMTRLIERSGFYIVGKMMRSNNPEGIGLPDRTDKGVRGFYLLSSTHFVPA